MYRIKTSEKNNDKATEFETKSLLYLLTKIEGYQNIDLFIIDCFNDVTGVENNYQESWDVQSKGVSNLTPRAIGISLYTLFANYVSDIDFTHYLLFAPPIKDDYLNDVSVEYFSISNFKIEKVDNIKAGLKAEIERRNDPDVNTSTKLLLLDEFLNDVIFIIDKYNKSDYIKSIIEFKDIKYIEDNFLIKIFDEIRALQSAKKIPNVYNEEVASIQDSEKFSKTISRRDIELLVINRIIGNDLFAKKGIPIPFIHIVSDMEEEDIIDVVEDCQSKISRTLFNKNNKKAFWIILEKIMIEVTLNPKTSVNEILSKIEPDLRKSVFTLDEISLLYLISLVKEGLNYENS